MHLAPIPETDEFNYLYKLKNGPESFSAVNEKAMMAYYRLNYSLILIHELRVVGDGILTGTENNEALISYKRLE